MDGEKLGNLMVNLIMTVENNKAKKANYIIGALILAICGEAVAIRPLFYNNYRTGVTIQGEEATAYYLNWLGQAKNYDGEEVVLTLPKGFRGNSTKSMKAGGKVVLVDEQYAFFKEIYSKQEKDFSVDDVKNLSKPAIETIVKDYWKETTFPTSRYAIFKIISSETESVTYICGYNVAKNLFYNLETNDLEYYSYSDVQKENNMGILMQIEEAKRVDILSAYHNYFNDNITLKRDMINLM